DGLSRTRHPFPTRRSSDLSRVSRRSSRARTKNKGKRMTRRIPGWLEALARQLECLSRASKRAVAVAADALALPLLLATALELKRSEEHTSELQSRENLVCR